MLNTEIRFSQRPLYHIGWTRSEIPFAHSSLIQIFPLWVRYITAKVWVQHSERIIKNVSSLIRWAEMLSSIWNVKKSPKLYFPWKYAPSLALSLSLSRGTVWNGFQGRLERRQHPFNCGRVSTSPSAATRHSVATTVAVNRFSERPVVFECCQTSGRTSSSKPFVLNPKTRNRLLGNWSV